MAKTQLVDLVSLNKIYSNLISNLGAKFNTLTTKYTDADTTLKNNLEGQLKTTNDTVSALDNATVKLKGTQTIKANNTFEGKNTFSGTGNSFTTAVTFSDNNEFTGANTFKTGTNKFESNVEFGTGSTVSFKNSSTDCSSTTTGAVKIAGGLGVAKTIYANAIKSSTSISAEGAISSKSISTTSVSAKDITTKTLYIGDSSSRSLINDVINGLIDNKMVKSLNYCGQFSTYDALKKAVSKDSNNNYFITLSSGEKTSLKIGDVFNISAIDNTYAKHNFVWSGDTTIEDNSGWDDLGDSQVDFINFETDIKKYLNGQNSGEGADNYKGSTEITTLGTVTSATFSGNNCVWSGKIIEAEKLDLSGKADWGTELSDYKIGDAKIDNGTITLGTNSIVPLTTATAITSPNNAEWGKEVTVGTLKTDSTSDDSTVSFKFTMPANPNTDYQCTNEGHYAPQADSSSTLSAVATSTESATWADTSAVTAVSLQRDDKGHVTGLNVMSRKFKFDNISTDVAFTSTTESNAVDEGAITISGGLGVAGNIYGSAVYNAVWNDIADCIEVDCELTAGYCYSFDGEHYYRTNEYMDGGCIGIHSDTAGMHVGSKGGNEMEVAIGGFVLAYVDKEYKVGTPLTCTEGGMLTEIKLEDKRDYPERIIATYWKNEPNEEWGSDTRKVKVNGRKWVKIK